MITGGNVVVRSEKWCFLASISQGAGRAITKYMEQMEWNKQTKQLGTGGDVCTLF